jgi:hypothetical protein
MKFEEEFETELRRKISATYVEKAKKRYDEDRRFNAARNEGGGAAGRTGSFWFSEGGYWCLLAKCIDLGVGVEYFEAHH